MSGATRIFLYNWPVYAGTWSGAVMVLLVAKLRVGDRAAWLVAAATVAVVWSAASLLVSRYIYDRSALASARWVRALLPARVERWATIDAGLDAEVGLDPIMPGVCIARLDIYDGDSVRAPSVRRARSLTPRTHQATPTRATALSLESNSCDVVAVVFTAHEVRKTSDREVFFGELRRILRDGGRLLLVEHLRDVPNFLAFGPGYLHFTARSEWMRLAERSHFDVVIETRITPWVMALALEKRA